jgi:hypothetical protein
MTVEALKKAIAELPEEERASLAGWLIEHDYDDWDKQMAEDFSPGGRGMNFYGEVQRQISERKTRPMEEGFAERRTGQS